jgi:hypothetical protein
MRFRVILCVLASFVLDWAPRNFQHNPAYCKSARIPQTLEGHYWFSLLSDEKAQCFEPSQD